MSYSFNNLYNKGKVIGLSFYESGDKLGAVWFTKPIHFTVTPDITLNFEDIEQLYNRMKLETDKRKETKE